MIILTENTNESMQGLVLKEYTRRIDMTFGDLTIERLWKTGRGSTEVLSGQ